MLYFQEEIPTQKQTIKRFFKKNFAQMSFFLVVSINVSLTGNQLAATKKNKTDNFPCALIKTTSKT